MTTKQKIQALVDGGLADDAEDAGYQLVDMGEASETAVASAIKAINKEAK